MLERNNRAFIFVRMLISSDHLFHLLTFVRRLEKFNYLAMLESIKYLPFSLFAFLNN